LALLDQRAHLRRRIGWVADDDGRHLGSERVD
jgi:hypothetical protein